MRIGWVGAVPDRNIASFRYRVEAPMAGLRARGHEVEFLDPVKVDDYGVAVFSKAYGPEHRALAGAIKRGGGSVVLDLCDNHFYNPYDLARYKRARADLGKMMEVADRVICSTRALADVVRDETGGDVAPIVVGDVVERIKPRRRVRMPGDPLHLTWFGSHGSPNAPSGMTDLALIRMHLEALAARHPVEITVCSNNREKFEQSIAEFRVPTRYVEWSLAGLPKLLASTDAVLLPIDINPFTACKTHDRLSMALYSGTPVLASGIDSYKDFEPYCTLDDWEGGLDALVEDPDAERQRALESRNHIDQCWTIASLSSQWEAALALPSGKASLGSKLKTLRLQGRLDAVARGAVTGWVTTTSRSNLRLQVVLECDGEPVAVALADRPREDLAVMGLRRDCGFSLPLPPRMAGGSASRLTVRVLDTDWTVGENPIVVGADDNLSFAPASTSGRIELRGDQRWDVSEAIAEQERSLITLAHERNTRLRSTTAAAKAALGLQVERREAAPAS